MRIVRRVKRDRIIETLSKKQGKSKRAPHGGSQTGASLRNRSKYKPRKNTPKSERVRA